MSKEVQISFITVMVKSFSFFWDASWHIILSVINSCVLSAISLQPSLVNNTFQTGLMCGDLDITCSSSPACKVFLWSKAWEKAFYLVCSQEVLPWKQSATVRIHSRHQWSCNSCKICLISSLLSRSRFFGYIQLLAWGEPWPTCLESPAHSLPVCVTWSCGDRADCRHQHGLLFQLFCIFLGYFIEERLVLQSALGFAAVQVMHHGGVPQECMCTSLLWARKHSLAWCWVLFVSFCLIISSEGTIWSYCICLPFRGGGELAGVRLEYYYGRKLIG